MTELDPKGKSLLRRVKERMRLARYHDDDVSAPHNEDELLRDVAAYLDALSAFPEGQGPKVKPLVWEGVGDGFVKEQAECILGLYRLAQSRITGTWRWSLNALDGPWSLVLQTLDEAKTAAQSDYSTRILSALALPLSDAGETK